MAWPFRKKKCTHVFAIKADNFGPVLRWSQLIAYGRRFSSLPTCTFLGSSSLESKEKQPIKFCPRRPSSPGILANVFPNESRLYPCAPPRRSLRPTLRPHPRAQSSLSARVSALVFTNLCAHCPQLPLFPPTSLTVLVHSFRKPDLHSGPLLRPPTAVSHSRILIRLCTPASPSGLAHWSHPPALLIGSPTGLTHRSHAPTSPTGLTHRSILHLVSLR